MLKSFSNVIGVEVQVKIYFITVKAMNLVTDFVVCMMKRWSKRRITTIERDKRPLHQTAWKHATWSYEKIKSNSLQGLYSFSPSNKKVWKKNSCSRFYDKTPLDMFFRGCRLVSAQSCTISFTSYGSTRHLLVNYSDDHRRRELQWRPKTKKINLVLVGVMYISFIPHH